jgi:hypothetical protein
MARNEIFIYTRVAHLIATETLIRNFDAPNTDLGVELFIDFLDYIWVFNDQLQ